MKYLQISLALTKPRPLVKYKLAHIESQAEQDAVFGLITGDTWVGGNDRDKYKKWIWYNGAKINKNFYRNW